MSYDPNDYHGTDPWCESCRSYVSGDEWSHKAQTCWACVRLKESREANKQHATARQEKEKLNRLVQKWNSK